MSDNSDNEYKKKILDEQNAPSGSESLKNISKISENGEGDSERLVANGTSDLRRKLNSLHPDNLKENSILTKSYCCPESLDFKQWAIFIRKNWGPNTIPAISLEKRPKVETWTQYQDTPITDELHNSWENNQEFDKGIQIILGKIWHNQERIDSGQIYLWCVDIDNEAGKRAFLKALNKHSVEELAQDFIVEQHDGDPSRLHVYGYSSFEFKFMKGTDDRYPRIELKCDGKRLICCCPSYHSDGTRYKIIGITEIPLGVTFDNIQQIVEDTYREYNIPFNSGDNATSKNKKINDDSYREGQQQADYDYNTLIKEGFEVREGNRHNTLMRLIGLHLARILLKPSKKKPEEIIEEAKKFFDDWNQKCCKPPLPQDEVHKCLNDILEDREKDRKRKNDECESLYNSLYDLDKKKGFTDEEKQKSNEWLENICPELKGNIYYQTNIDPIKFIVAFKGSHHLIEIQLKITKLRDKDGNVYDFDISIIHNKTYLMCIPDKVTRHINPFLHIESEEAAPKISTTFKDQKGEQHTFSHKTLAGIMSSLKEHHYILGDGAESALSAIIQGFKEMGKIEDNQDVDVEGFFIDRATGKIRTSKVKIEKPKIETLTSALNLLDELAEKYYANRKDLLATSIVWGVIAPVIFILKDALYYLEYLYFYGASKALKSTIGNTVLAIDGHHYNLKYSLKYTQIDTVPRFGSKVKNTTFPLLVDEVDLNNPISASRDTKEKLSVINAIKTAVDNKIAREKFENSKDSDTIPIPALSPLILTSNFQPPTYNTAFMRRMIDRHFPESESKIVDDEESIACQEFMRMNLDRLGALGNFRNWYMMNNQDLILNEKRPPPLDLGLKIICEAYSFIGKPVPEWLSQRLPKNQLEIAVQDNAMLVKRAFIKYIDKEYARATSMWRAADIKFHFQKHVSYRLKELGEYGLLHNDIKVKVTSQNGFEAFSATIGKGILEELYQNGVTHDQCPNLRQLADYMDGKYYKTNGNMVIGVHHQAIIQYFNDFEDELEPDN